MRIEQLTLVNFCNHRQRQIEFHSGTSAIIGPNGSGKSGIMGAIRFLMTGENPHSGVKTANICDRAPTTETSYASLVFSHGPIRATVRRNLRPARPTAIMTFENGDVIEGDQDVTARIQQILGVSTTVLNEIVIVSQADILSFIDKSAGKRAELFQRLFNTQMAEVIYKAIGDKLKTVEIPTVGVSKDALVAELHDKDVELGSLRQQLDGVATYETINAAKKSNSDVVTAYHSLQAARDRLTSLNGQYQQTESAYNQAQATVAQYERDRVTVEAAMNNSAADVDQARLKLNMLSTFKAQQLAISNADQQVMQLQTRRNQTANTAPQLPANYVADQTAAESQLNSIAATVRQCQQLVGSFSSGCIECPTCHTPTSSLTGKLEEAKQQIAKLQPEHAALAAAIKASKEYDRLQTQHKAALESLDEQLNLSMQHRNALPLAEAVTVNEAQAQQAITQHQTYVDGVREYDQMLTQARGHAARLQGSMTTLVQQREQVQREIADLPQYTLEECNTATTYVGQWEAVATQRRQLETQLAVCENQVNNINQQIENAERVERSARGIRAAYQHMETVRSLFNKDAAPRFVAQQNLQALNVAMNENLQMFGSDFTVQADEGLSFNALFPNGSIQPAERLSGGQKVVLALAFRLALNMMFAENIGALYLDEPTAWLDENHIRGFEPVLHRLREFSTSRGLQSIIVTHERRLAPLFDSVIQL